MPKPSAIVGSLILLPIVVALTEAVPAQGGVAWTQLRPVNSPSPRFAHEMATDTHRQRLVLFGGMDWNGVASALSSATWEWNGLDWTQAMPRQSPPARRDHAMAYDAARRRIVLFGGTWPAFQDTWEWNGLNWTQAMPGQSPTARWHHAMVYDAARARVVLFGGYDGAYLADTWEWDGVTWTQATSSQGPSSRRMHAMAYDPARERVVLFGGLSPRQTFLADTWEWDGTNWIPVSPIYTPSPSSRRGHAMAYDAARQRVVLTGGHNLTPTPHIWEWDGMNWSRLSSAYSPTPSGRHEHALAHDPTHERLVLFGGVTSYPSWTYGDTWEYRSISPASLVAFGIGCPGSTGTPTLDATPFSSPWTGDTFSADLGNLPPGAMTFMVTGLSNTFWTGALIRLPAPLISWGMPGCMVYTDVLDSELLLNTSGVATWTKTIPNDANLIGLTFYNQAFIIDPGVNALGATVSNAGQATIGMR